MRTARHRALNVAAIVDEVRRQHPELHRLTPRRIRRAIAADGIRVLEGRIRRPARSRAFDGVYVITLRRGLGPREAARWALHEYAHIKLGHFSDGEEIERQLTPCRAGDPREVEAEMFVLMLRLGSEATPETPAVARLVAELEAPRYVKRMPAQLPLELPEGAPVYKPESERRPAIHQPGAPRPRTPRGHRPKLLGSSIGLGVSHNSLLFDWSRDGKPLRYFHLKLGWIDVYDGLRVGEPGKMRWELLKFGDRRASHRVFVISSSDRRRYAFLEGEKRGRGPKELDAQIRVASRVRAEADQPLAGTHERQPR